jgi:GDPmannose 4,6-dehydratase
MKKKALIFGCTGQDGYYLSKHLLSNGYYVIGTSRDLLRSNSIIFDLSNNNDIKFMDVSPTDYRSVFSAISEVKPHEIYNLTGQSSVGFSYEQPVETIESIVNPTLNILEAIRFIDPRIRLYNAGSSECFGETKTTKANENSPFRPLSPYAVAKSASANLVASYRISYQLWVCTGFLFNHESPIRPPRFVTQKIVQSAALIKARKLDILQLGNINIARDWGWAPDYVEAMHKMLQCEDPRDFIIATGKTVSLEYFIESTFAFFNLDWREHVMAKNNLGRPSDILFSSADPTRAKEILNWQATYNVDDVIREMCISAERLSKS